MTWCSSQELTAKCFGLPPPVSMQESSYYEKPAMWIQFCSSLMRSVLPTWNSSQNRALSLTGPSCIHRKNLNGEHPQNVSSQSLNLFHWWPAIALKGQQSVSLPHSASLKSLLIPGNCMPLSWRKRTQGALLQGQKVRIFSIDRQFKVFQCCFVILK